MNVYECCKNACKKSKKIFNMSSFLYTLFGRNVIKKGNYNSCFFKGAFLKQCHIKIYGKNNHILIDPGVVCKKCTVIIYGDNNNIYIKERAQLLNVELYMEDNDNLIEIGKHTGILGNTHIACTEGMQVKIGEECLFSSNIQIRTGDSHGIFNLLGERINYAGNVEIGNHVWVGNDVKILKGVTIYDDIVIATGSIVTKSITSSNLIIGGNPAKILKENIYWTHERN